jgi:Holliday junction resolvasome RuvABC endonuclease subunit
MLLDRPLRVVGFDPSLRNWGVAHGTFTGESLQIESVALAQPVLPTGKQVRQNSLDLAAAEWLYRYAMVSVVDADAVFVEVPQGSQSARASAAYGVVAGVLGSLRANSIPFFELTPTEVKLATGLTKNATKEQMITWAMAQHPNNNWPRYVRGGETKVSESKAEHMADAVAAIHAGLNLTSFKQMLKLSFPPALPNQTKESILCSSP